MPSITSRRRWTTPSLRDRKSTRLNSVTPSNLVCRLLLEKKKIYAENRGIAFGQLQEGGQFGRCFFVVLAIAAAISVLFYFFFSNGTANTVIYTGWFTLSLHDALLI